MTTWVPPHLPVHVETDNTRNWESLQTFLANEFEGGSGGGGALFKSYVATEQETTAAKGAEPKVLATPDEVSFTLDKETLVLVSASFKCRTPGIGPTKCWLYLDNVTAKNEDEKAIKGEHNATEFQQMNLLTRENPASLISDNTTTATGVGLDLGSLLPFWLKAGSHKFDLRFDGTIGGTFFKERRLLVFIPGSELSSAPLASGAAGGDLEGTYPNPKIVKSVLAGEWTAMTLGAKIEEDATLHTVRCRKEDSETVVRLRGGLKVKGGEELKGLETAATLPAGFRPAKQVAFQFGYPELGALAISTAGVVVFTGNAKATQVLYLDGISFNLT